MDEPLLRTKLYIPVVRPDPATRLRTNFVLRPRLVEQLNEGLLRRLTLISAPAGFGKTTLVTSWLEQVNLPAAWLSLDPEDNDFARFWTYVIAALQTIHPDLGTAVLTLLRSSPLPPGRTLLTPLLNDLTAVSAPFTLVLDDYHAIENETIDQALTFFLEHLPPSLHLVITSRVDPNLPLARLRAHGQLQELRSAELRFTPAESAQFLEQMTAQRLTVEQVAALEERTQGWVAGLQMAALSLRQREAASVAQFIRDFSGSHRFIMDYLMDEVLQRQPAEVQTFLLYTSILDRLCGPLCQALLQEGEAREGGVGGAAPPSGAPETSRAQESLAHLEHANLFITPLDEQHHWYRYHPLFADLLRQRLEQTGPDRVRALHLRASEWYEHAGMTDPAVQHALAAQAFGRAATLVERVALGRIQRSEVARLLTWFDTLPEDEVQARPRLALLFVRALVLSGQITQAAQLLKAIEAEVATDEAKRTSEMQAHIAAMRAYLAREIGDFASTIALSQQALAHLPKEETLLRAIASLNLAIAHYLQGEFELAARLLTDTIATGQTDQQMATTLSAIYLQAQLLRAQGNLQQALQLCQAGLVLVDRNGWQDFPAAGWLYVAWGDLLCERNELTLSAEYLEKGIERGQEGGHPHILIIGHVRRAWLRQTLGDGAGSQEDIRTALQVTEQHQVSRFWTLPPADCYQARLWIAQGNLSAASRWTETRGLNQIDRPATFLYEVENLTLVRLLIAQGKLEVAEDLLLRLHRAAASGERSGSLIEILVLQAITFAKQKRDHEALTALDQALRVAEPEGFVRIFLDEGAPMVELLRRAVAQGLHAPYALRLLNAVGQVAKPQPLTEPLSERELEVLRRVAAGYSNQDIARELVVAVSTVKRHVSNIYGKLEVENRTQAVARARELGLL